MQSGKCPSPGLRCHCSAMHCQGWNPALGISESQRTPCCHLPMALKSHNGPRARTQCCDKSAQSRFRSNVRNFDHRIPPWGLSQRWSPTTPSPSRQPADAGCSPSPGSRGRSGVVACGQHDDKSADQPRSPRPMNRGPGVRKTPSGAAWGPVLPPGTGSPRARPRNQRASPPPAGGSGRHAWPATLRPARRDASRPVNRGWRSKIVSSSSGCACHLKRISTSSGTPRVWGRTHVSVGWRMIPTRRARSRASALAVWPSFRCRRWPATSEPLCWIQWPTGSRFRSQSLLCGRVCVAGRRPCAEADGCHRGLAGVRRNVSSAGSVSMHVTSAKPRSAQTQGQ
jgi:hypothetical protein